MALSATLIWECRTTGHDTNNGGAFDPGQTAGMFTDGAATSATGTAPVFSSASYNFVAGDVGARVYIASGTNWTAGWYTIDSVASNVATLNGTTGAGVLAADLSPTTADGCATTASPTGATWTIDYSVQNSAQFTYTDLSSTGVGLTASSAGNPFGKQQVGNMLVVTGGTNFTQGRYILASVAAGVGTFQGAANLHTGAGTDSDGTGGLGGGLISPALVAANLISGHTFFIKSGTYSITSASTNVANGCFAGADKVYFAIGYNTVRTAANTGTAPIWQVNVASATILTGSYGTWLNVVFDGNTQTSARWYSSAGCLFVGCTAKNFTLVSSGTGATCVSCLFTGNSVCAPQTALCVFCEATANTATPFTGHSLFCLSYDNTGASTDGFSLPNNSMTLGCSAVGNGRAGYLLAGHAQIVMNAHAEANTGPGFRNGAAGNIPMLIRDGSYNNSARSDFTPGPARWGIDLAAITLSGSAFTNVAGDDYSLNATASAGAALRSAAYVSYLTGPSQTFPAGLTASKEDVGAARHADPAATGGGGTPVNIFTGS